MHLKVGAVSAPFEVLSFFNRISARWPEPKPPAAPLFPWANRTGQYGLSEHYVFEIEALIDTFTAPDRLLGQPAQLQCDNTVFHGYLAEIRLLPRTDSGHRYRLTLSSPLYPLTQQRRSQVFIDKNPSDILIECLTAHHWQQGPDADYVIDLQQDYPSLACWIQHHENDYDHLQRLMRRYGLFFYFDQHAENATLIIRDYLKKTDPLPLSFHQHNQRLFDVQALGDIGIQATIQSNYKPDTPAEPWIFKHTAKTATPYGVLHQHDTGASSAQEGAHLSRVQQESMDWQSAITLASTTIPGLQPGQTIAISDHPISTLNQSYTIVDIEHHGRRHANPQAPNYYNRLLLIPEALPFRQYDGYTPVMQAPLRAKLESDIDETGSYRFRYPFDTSDKNPVGLASPKTRFTQLMGTAGRGLAGMHFPSQPGTEVELAFLQGNICLPVIIGALSTPAVVTADNAHQALVRTTQGSEWCLDDTPDNEGIVLSTPEKKDLLALKAHTEKTGITLKTNTGSMQFNAGQSLHFTTAETLSIQATDYDVMIQESYHLDAKDRIDWETAGYFFLKAEVIRFNSQTFSLSNEEELIMQTDTLQTACENTQSTTLQFCSQQTLSIEAANMQITAETQLSIENAGAKIVFENGNLTLNSPTEIEFISESVSFLGAQQRG
jgi:Rhs element Vgr protein